MATARQPSRLRAVDAMRGIAALAVVLFHVPVSFREAAGVPAYLDAVFASGWLGVDAFFVLSGFVISLSVLHGEWDARYLLRFLARRSVRLDPAYWVAIIVEPMLGWVGIRFLGDAYPLPTTDAVLAHLVYLQELLGFPQISQVFWTLCYEVQFYLLLVGSLVMATTLERRAGISRRYTLGVLLFSFVVYSLLSRVNLVERPLAGLMIDRSYQFALGIIAWLFASGRVGSAAALPALGAIVLARCFSGSVLEAIVVATASAVCVAAVKFERFNELADKAPLQFLGRISYSLYLFHAMVIIRGATVLLMLIGRVGAPQWLAVPALLALIAGAVFFSYVMYRAVEVPTLRLSRRISLAR